MRSSQTVTIFDREQPRFMRNQQYYDQRMSYKTYKMIKQKNIKKE